jgi:hypothetical protein
MSDAYGIRQPASTDTVGSAYRLKFEDEALDQLLAACDVYMSRDEAFAAFAAAVADPPPGAGSVYLTQDDRDDEVVVAGHNFIDTTPSG